MKTALWEAFKQILPLVLFVFGLTAIAIGLDLCKENDLKNKYVAFKNDGILVCYGTLIVTNSNWKLVEDNLINNNSAGYIDIKKCIIKQ